MNQLAFASEDTRTRFAMNRLGFGLQEQSEPLTAPPYELFEDESGYHVYFNMFGIPESDIKVRVDEVSHEFTVFAEREKRSYTDQYLWIFRLPENINMDLFETSYKLGVVQFTFPTYTAIASKIIERCLVS